jgi:hypothetical protein
MEISAGASADEASGESAGVFCSDMKVGTPLLLAKHH